MAKYIATMLLKGSVTWERVSNSVRAKNDPKFLDEVMSNLTELLSKKVLDKSMTYDDLMKLPLVSEIPSLKDKINEYLKQPSGGQSPSKSVELK